MCAPVAAERCGALVRASRGHIAVAPGEIGSRFPDTPALVPRQLFEQPGQVLGPLGALRVGNIIARFHAAPWSSSSRQERDPDLPGGRAVRHRERKVCVAGALTVRTVRLSDLCDRGVFDGPRSGAHVRSPWRRESRWRHPGRRTRGARRRCRSSLNRKEASMRSFPVRARALLRSWPMAVGHHRLPCWRWEFRGAASRCP